MEYDIYIVRIYRQSGDEPDPETDEFLGETSIRSGETMSFGLTVDAPAGKQEVYAVTEDRAGNKSIHSNVVSFTMENP